MISSIVKFVVGRVRAIGDTDGTAVGNYSDRLKTIPIPDKTGTGTITSGSGATSHVDAPTDGCGGVTFQVLGTWVATLVFEATIDAGVTWFAVSAVNVISRASLTSTAANGKYSVSCGTYQQVRIRASAYTSGTATVVWNSGQVQQASTNTEILSPLPGFVARSNKVLAAGASTFTTYTMVADIALIDFHFGGRGIGQASVLRIVPATTEQVPGGGFNSSGDVALWTNTSTTTLTAPSPDYSTVQAYEGTGSLRQIFTQSAGNTLPQMDYTWGNVTPKDCSQWRYISAQFYNPVAAGGSQSRTISIILTDVNGNSRTYSVTGTTVAAPFATAQWINILGEIEVPTSESGTFDVYNVASLRLQLKDGGNKSGTLYWDDVKFIGAQTLIERIYIDANRTFQLILNPVELFSTGEVLGLLYKNNDVASKEYTATAKGVLR